MSDDPVGYGKPPKQHRFKPGNKAAAGKRRIKDKPIFSIAQALIDAIATPMPVQRGNERITMAAGEVYAKRLARVMTSGNAREMMEVMRLIERHLPQSLAAPQERLEVVYIKAEGSSVALPPSDLWQEGEQS